MLRAVNVVTLTARLPVTSRAVNVVTFTPRLPVTSRAVSKPLGELDTKNGDTTVLGNISD